MKNILFYGDSLVYGKLPKQSKRYDRSKNFIGRIESKLSDKCHIIDEGLRARNLVGENNFFPDRDGLKQFGPIIGSHLPVDIVFIFLGTNDCNKKDTKNNNDIYDGLLGYKNKINDWCKGFGISDYPTICVVVPPKIRADQIIYDDPMNNIFGVEAEEKFTNLKEIYKDFCEKENCIFFDSNIYCKTADNEGVHLDEENNIKLGEALVEKIISLIE